MKISFLRTIFKNAFFFFFHLLGGFSLFRWLNKNRLLILLYHGVLPKSTKGDDYLNYNFIVKEEFQWQMEYLKRNYKILPLSEIVNRLEKKIPFPPYSAVITFDDGFQNNFTYAFPILKEMGIPAAIFISTGFIGTQHRMLWTEKIGHFLKHTKDKIFSFKIENEAFSFNLITEKDREKAASKIVGLFKKFKKNKRDKHLKQLLSHKDFSDSDKAIDDSRYRFLNWEEVKLLSKHGIEIGSHTVNHEILSGLTENEAIKEMHKSKKEIEKILGIPCDLFSYPNGGKNDFSERDKMALKKTGYRCAVSLIKDINLKNPDVMALRRVNIGRRHNRIIFRATISGFIPFLSNTFSQQS